MVLKDVAGRRTLGWIFRVERVDTVTQSVWIGRTGQSGEIEPGKMYIEHPAKIMLDRTLEPNICDGET